MPNTRTERQWIKEYKERGILLLHNGKDPESPHALLTSGNHSNGYFDTPPLLDNKRLLHQAASALIDHYLLAGGNIEVIDRVVGPKTGGAKLAKALAKEIALRRGRPCKWGVVTKYADDESKLMLFDEPELAVTPGEVVLVCDDVFTTGGSVGLTIDAVERARSGVVFIICVLVNRFGQHYFQKHEVVALINKQMHVWAPADCPLCKLGSTAVKQRRKANAIP